MHTHGDTPHTTHNSEYVTHRIMHIIDYTIHTSRIRFCYSCTRTYTHTYTHIMSHVTSVTELSLVLTSTTTTLSLAALPLHGCLCSFLVVCSHVRPSQLDHSSLVLSACLRACLFTRHNTNAVHYSITHHSIDHQRPWCS